MSWAWRSHLGDGAAAHESNDCSACPHCDAHAERLEQRMQLVVIVLVPVGLTGMDRRLRLSAVQLRVAANLCFRPILLKNSNPLLGE
jgi:hypothetical protein